MSNNLNKVVVFHDLLSCRTSISMEFISNEAAEEESECKLVFSDDSSDEEFLKKLNLIKNLWMILLLKKKSMERVFTGNWIIEKIISNFRISKNPIEVVDEEEPNFLGEDDLPELYDPEDREQVDFDLSDSTADKSAQFRKIFLCFFNVDNHFSNSVVYRLMYLKGGEHFIEIKNARETLGDELFFKLKEIENFCMLDHSVFGFFDRCQKMTEVLSGYGYFLRFYERGNKFRYQIRKKLEENNEIRKELSSCIVPKFNGYEILRNHLNSKERQEYLPIDNPFSSFRI